MQTVITLKSSELSHGLIKRLTAFMKVLDNSEITISIFSDRDADILRAETQAATTARIEQAIEDVRAGRVISFTGKEFKKLSARLLKKKAD